MEFYDKHTITEYQGKSLDNAGIVIEYIGSVFDYNGKFLKDPARASTMILLY
jgi:hypothetical protein